MTKLHGDDGAILEVKEGVVLDQDGNTLAAPQRTHERFSAQRPHTKIFVWRPSPFLVPLLIIPALVFVFSIGLTLFAAFAVLGLLGSVVYSFFRLFRGR